MQPNPQPGVVPATHHGPKFNALKHGLYAETIVLPEEDLAVFRRSRQLAFLEFRPQTVDEAELVDAMVECRWQFKRCRPLQAEADGQTQHPERDAAQRIVEPHTHQRTHTSMDVTVHRNRIDKLESRLRGKLHVSQKQRRLGLMEGAVKLPQGCYMEVDGEVVQVVDAPRVPTRVCQVADVLPQPISGMGITPSSDRADGFCEEQKENATTATPADMPRQVGSDAPMAETPGGITGWAALPGEIVVLGMMDDVILPRRRSA